MTQGIRLGAKQRWSLLVVIALLIGSCSQAETPQAASLSQPAAAPQIVEKAAPTPEELTAGLPKLNGKATVEIMVGSKPITIEVDGEHAPITAGNFVDLAQKGVYDGTIFHRVVRSPDPFVVQGGDPQSIDPNVPTSQLGTGGYIDPDTGVERMIPLEIQPQGADQPLYGQTFPEANITDEPVLGHRRGAVAMARSGPNTASAQFYITLADVAFLDGNYAVLGYVTSGMDIVDKIQLGDVITSVTVKSGAENLVQPTETTDETTDETADETAE
ncbi:MAG: peptidylprolyl isomerase [Phormidesmis sp. RL_2_1]|nr:peptidylprolyl isomerase [Phormidesmis sp. RL_2_1]